MRTYRAIVAALVAVFMAVALSTVSTGTATARAGSTVSTDMAGTVSDKSRSRPSRVIEEQSPVQVRALAARIKGNVTQPVIDPATGAVVAYDRYTYSVVKIHVKKCGKCGWKSYKKVKTNKFGTYKYFAKVPMKGLWKYRATVPASQGYAKTRSRPQGVWLG